MKCFFGVDIGGTEIKIGKFDANNLINKYSIKTNINDDGKNIFNDICEFITSNTVDDELLGIGIAVPGPVLNGVVLGAQNIGWKVVELEKKFKQVFPKTEIKILNDANAATFGEMKIGGAKGCSNVVMLTLGTGIGGGIIINGKLIEGNTGSTGEVGHIKIYHDNGRSCTCGLFGCLEQYASATGIVKTALELRKNKNTLLNKENLTCKDVFDFALKGDIIANEVVEKSSYDLGIGCANIANVINPEAIIIGGGVSKAGEFFMDKIRKVFREMAFYSVKETKLVLATLGNDAGIYGCYYSVKELFDESN